MNAPVRGLAHVAIATPAADALAARLVDALGATRGADERLDDGALRVVFVHVGPVTFELLEPQRDDHTVAKFLAKRGPGIHHLTIRVAALDETLRALESRGVVLLDRVPRIGAGGTRIAFLHPKSTAGVLIELCEAPPDPADQGSPNLRRP